jgi:hypothetical protein
MAVVVEVGANLVVDLKGAAATTVFAVPRGIR